MASHLQTAQRTYGVRRLTSCIIVIAPFVLLGGFFFLISFGPTQDFAALMTYPNYPIEWVTFGTCLAAGVGSWRIAFRLKKQGEPAIVWMFYAVFGLGLVWTAGETSAWGQQVLGYPTPEWMLRRNAQGQMTLHNMGVWQNHNHWLRTAFGAGGLVGITLQKSRRYRKIAAPPILFFWFLLITFKCALDFWTKSFSPDSTYAWVLFQWIVNRTSKVVKMMIGISSLLYIWLNSRVLSRNHPGTGLPG